MKSMNLSVIIIIKGPYPENKKDCRKIFAAVFNYFITET